MMFNTDKFYEVQRCMQVDLPIYLLKYLSSYVPHK